MEERLQELDRCIDIILGTCIGECGPAGKFGTDMNGFMFSNNFKDSCQLLQMERHIESMVKSSLSFMGFSCYDLKVNKLVFEERESMRVKGRVYMLIEIFIDFYSMDGKVTALKYERRIF